MEKTIGGRHGRIRGRKGPKSRIGPILRGLSRALATPSLSCGMRRAPKAACARAGTPLPRRGGQGCVPGHNANASTGSVRPPPGARRLPRGAVKTAKVRAFVDLIGPRRRGRGLARRPRGQLAQLPQRLLPTLPRVLGADRGAVRRAHPAAAHGRQSALFEAAKEQIS
jgi:hypothetical protein